MTIDFNNRIKISFMCTKLMHALYLIETGNIMDSTFSRGMVTILGINYFYVLSVYNASTIGIFVIGSLKLSVIR